MVLVLKIAILSDIAQEVEAEIVGDVIAIVPGVTVCDVANEN